LQLERLQIRTATHSPKFERRLKLAAQFALVPAVAIVFDWNCPFYSLSGHVCPGCGMTRAVLSLTRFDFESAWNFSQLLFLAPLIFLPIIVNFFRPTRGLKALSIALGIITVVVYGVYRVMYPPSWS
jgi:ribosomal protein L32